jgi:hypothetical protein
MYRFAGRVSEAFEAAAVRVRAAVRPAASAPLVGTGRAAAGRTGNEARGAV